MRRFARLAVEVTFGLLNPLLYLTILIPSLPVLQPEAWWFAPLTTTAWILLAVFWMYRIFGAALDPSSRLVRICARTLLVTALAWVWLHGLKDLALLVEAEGNRTPPITLLLVVLRCCPLYLIPAVLLWDYIRQTSTRSPQAAATPRGLFLLPGRASRVAGVGLMGIALVTVAVAANRQSDSTVRRLVNDHQVVIRAAGTRYEVDPRLIASIVYVTHRDQLSPFRDTLERLVIAAWANNLRQDFGFGPPDRVEEIGTDENPLLNQALDISVGMCALILSLYQNQWEAANPDWSLRRRPDILATLYQIGFARSRPHDAPQSNAFGRRVREMYEQPWMEELF
jgi:hypothetical protein